ncbi:MAG: hypothetical protein AAF849_02255 [Bacteroidota bacterium]
MLPTQSLLQFSLLIVVVLIPPAFVWIDTMILLTRVSEVSLTEFTQLFFVLTTCGIFYRTAHRSALDKGFFTLLAGFFLTIAIRESDYFLGFVTRGFWKPLALISTLITLYLVYPKRGDTFNSLLKYWNTYSFTYLLIGLVLTLVFSRIFGTSNLWEPIMLEYYVDDFKTAIQEGLELLGYGLALLGSWYLSTSAKNNVSK